ncbi:MAG: oligosaccharide flippase family protein [Bacteroidales bacterium]|nr:oligosaccharide flippase family protein [Bacteroidales bacterium]
MAGFKKAFFKNILTLGGYNYSSQIASFLSSIVLSRLLMPEEYGYVALITVFTGFVIIFADAGLSFAIIRSDYGRTFHKAVTNLAFYIGFLLFLIMLLLAYPIAYFYNDQTLVMPTMVLSITFIVGAFKIVPMAIITKDLDFNYVGKVRLISNLIGIAMMIILAFLGFSYWSLIIPQIFLQLVQFILFENKVKLGFKFYKLSYTIVGFKMTKSLITNVSGFNLINYWSRNADNLIIGKFYSSFDLGIYNRAYKMLQLSLNLITGLFGTVLYPSLKKYKSEGGSINKEYASILGVISIISFPIGAILMLIPNTFVRILWGENWMMVADLLPYFGILIIFQTLISTTGHIYILLEKEKTFMYVGVASAIILVSAIVIGSLYSVVVIAIIYTFSYIAFIVPIQLYVGFYRTYGFSLKYLLKFWVPKLVIGFMLVISILFEQRLMLFGLLSIYLIHILYFQRNDLKKLRELLTARIKNNRSYADYNKDINQ